MKSKKKIYILECIYSGAWRLVLFTSSVMIIFALIMQFPKFIGTIILIFLFILASFTVGTNYGQK